ncbi:MAG: hypothetical protein JXA82_15860 [Sedimentisphaerales bacterium]|nr:hypothetical protein [Sedimentisphaerales bacterium]
MNYCAIVHVDNERHLDFENQSDPRIRRMIKEYNYKFLGNIISAIKEKEIICKRIKVEGVDCIGVKSKYEKFSYGILLHDFQLVPSGSEMISRLYCMNYFSRWKRIFGIYGPKEMYRGGGLDKFTAIVQEVVSRIPCVLKAEWMSPDDARKKIITYY